MVRQVQALVGAELDDDLLLESTGGLLEVGTQFCSAFLFCPISVILSHHTFQAEKSNRWAVPLLQCCQGPSSLGDTVRVIE